LFSPVTTVFRNEYRQDHRTQHVLSRAFTITPEDVPAEWRSTKIVLLGPVCGEVPADMARVFRGSLLGVSAQGWLRRVEPDGLVVSEPWNDVALWRASRVIFVSEEDLAGDESPPQEWAEHAPIVCLTRSHMGARVHFDGAWHNIEAFPEKEVDPTGAGDVFATAFLTRLHETNDVAEATRFAAAAASLSTAAEGTLAIPTREQIEERLARSPEIVLR
jgi:sugar/nucleoside kinase (ribokinase family)